MQLRYLALAIALWPAVVHAQNGPSQQDLQMTIQYLQSRIGQLETQIGFLSGQLQQERQKIEALSAQLKKKDDAKLDSQPTPKPKK